MTDQRTTIRGAELAYERIGLGPDLIWGHGLSQTRANEGALPLLDWSQIAATVVRYDARGHGLSETTPELDGYSWEELAHDQLALADHLGIDSYIAAGASMGAGTALHAAVVAPHRISRLVLTIPPTGWETRAAQVDQWELTAQIIESKGVEPIIAARADMAPPDPFLGDDDRREAQAAATRSWDPVRLAQVMRGATTANLPDRDQIAAISAPTLILAWTGDPIHPMSTAEELHGLIPDAELRTASTAEELAGWTDLVARFVAA
jgi:3-oxoadipate enol-lactonase